MADSTFGDCKIRIHIVIHANARSTIGRPDMTKYMVIETFRAGCKEKVYGRFHQRGRMLPDGLAYIDSWLERDGDRCFQLMETSDPSLFQNWLTHWSDLVTIEVVEIGPKPSKRSDH